MKDFLKNFGNPFKKIGDILIFDKRREKNETDIKNDEI